MWQRRRLGERGPRVAPIGLGTMYFGTLIGRDAAFAVLDAYAAAGGDFLDTAERYAAWVPAAPGGVGDGGGGASDGDGGGGGGHGASERVVGAWLRARGCRDRMVIGTKVTPAWSFGAGLVREQLPRAVEGSLRRLGCDHVDVLWPHWDDGITPPGEVVEALADLVARGLVGAVGLSNFDAARARQALAAAARVGVDICAVQVERNLVVPAPAGEPQEGDQQVGNPQGGNQQAFDGALYRLCRDAGLSVVAYAPLAQGLLARRDRDGGAGGGEDPGHTGRAGARAAYLADAGTRRRVARLRTMADELGVAPATVALAWLLQSEPHTVPVVGASTAAQLAEALAAAELALSPGQCRHLAPFDPDEPPPQEQQVTALNRLESIALGSADAAATARWYEAALGRSATGAAGGAAGPVGGAAAETAGPAAGTDGAGGAAPASIDLGGVALAFRGGEPGVALSFSVNDVDDAAGRLAARGLEVVEAPAAVDGGRAAALRDPDGRRVVIRRRDDPMQVLRESTPIVYLLVTDMARAVAFYRDTLGLPVTFQWFDLWVELQAGALTLAIEPNPRMRPGTGLEGATVMFRISHGIEAVVDRLRERGVAFAGPIKTLPHGKLATFFDPDGNVLQLHQGNPAFDGS